MEGRPDLQAQSPPLTAECLETKRWSVEAVKQMLVHNILWVHSRAWLAGYHGTSMVRLFRDQTYT